MVKVRVGEMFTGHKFVKLVTKEWVLDTADNVGYKVELEETHGECGEYGNENQADKNTTEKVKDYKRAFEVSTIDIDNRKVYFKKYTNVPVKVLHEASIQVLKHGGGKCKIGVESE